MLWQTSLAVIVLLAGGVIGAETAAPLEWKPSILLRASTGELPTRNFSAAREAERVKLLALEQSIATTRAEAEGLRQSDVELRATILALRERVSTKRLPKQRAECIEKSRVPPRRRKDGPAFIVSGPCETLRRAGDRAA